MFTICNKLVIIFFKRINIIRNWNIQPIKGPTIIPTVKQAEFGGSVGISSFFHWDNGEFAYLCLHSLFGAYGDCIATYTGEVELDASVDL